MSSPHSSAATGQRLCHRDVDALEGGRSDRRAHRRALRGDAAWTILRERLGWSRQRPARRALERDEEAIATWVARNGRAKSARRRGAWIVFQDESGFSLLPAVRATWAPRGETPVLHHHFSWTRLSMSAALAYRPDGTEAALLFQIKDGSYNTDR